MQFFFKPKKGGYDQDAGSFGKISYSLGDTFEGLFQIVDSSICVQKNIANITTGAAKFFNLEVIATDGGGLETRKNIRIRIEQHNNACQRRDKPENKRPLDIITTKTRFF